MIDNYIKRAKNGESIYICSVRDDFSSTEKVVECILTTATNETHSFTIPVSCPENAEDRAFVRDYFYSNLYNIISTFGGKTMTLQTSSENEFILELCSELDDVFQVNLPRLERQGYGKCLNVTDRVNEAMGHAPFAFITVNDKQLVCPMNDKTKQNVEKPNIFADAERKYINIVKKASTMVLLGLDIGGTDIKAIAAVNNRLAVFKEYDWNPAKMTSVSQLIDGVKGVVEDVCSELGQSRQLDGIGVGFPDVVIMNKIVGGETLKTRGIRNASPDYEKEFAGLLKLNNILLSYCKPGGVVSMTNDGSLAAFTAAVELAHSSRVDEIKNGVLAHTLGTELGTGWVDENGEVPQIPLEIYNCVVDVGNYPARKFLPFDLRSTLNFNTQIAGTMQKYASQSGAYRLAIDYFKKHSPENYSEMFKRGFIEERHDGLYVITSPEDMRKPLLEFIMKLADDNEPSAEGVFFEIGKYLAATWRETEFLLNPKAKGRIIYGRFVKSAKCMRLMQEGARTLKGASEFEMEAGNDELAYTPLMKELKENPHFTVAQFGQSVGAIYYALQNSQSV